VPLFPLLPVEEPQLTVGPPPEDTEDDAPALPPGVHDPGEDGGAAGPWALGTRASVVVPDGVLTWADVAVALPGHQATSQPSSTVATTSCPSSRTSVTPVTPDAVRPSTNV
jgi:hypothetical protein